MENQVESVSSKSKIESNNDRLAPMPTPVNKLTKQDQFLPQKLQKLKTDLTVSHGKVLSKSSLTTHLLATTSANSHQA